MWIVDAIVALATALDILVGCSTAPDPGKCAATFGFAGGSRGWTTPADPVPDLVIGGDPGPDALATWTPCDSP